MKNIKKRIRSVLKENPSGLTISKIAKLIGVHRSTIPKHLYELKGKKKVEIRRVGPAKLFYPAELTDKIENEKIFQELKRAM